jgi:hypothetical protein
LQIQRQILSCRRVQRLYSRLPPCRGLGLLLPILMTVLSRAHALATLGLLGLQKAVCVVLVRRLALLRPEIRELRRSTLLRVDVCLRARSLAVSKLLGVSYRVVLVGDIDRALIRHLLLVVRVSLTEERRTADLELLRILAIPYSNLLLPTFRRRMQHPVDELLPATFRQVVQVLRPII